MAWTQVRIAAFFGFLALSLIHQGALANVPEKTAAPPLPMTTADHASFEALKKEFESGSELTRACLSCHTHAARQLHATIHWKWQYENTKTGQAVGKRRVVNGGFLAISANEPYCARCHIGNEWTKTDFAFDAEEQVDCLVCHDTTGTYTSKKMHQLRAKCSACHVVWDKSLAREVVRKPDLEELAKHVGKPSIQNCGACHFYSDGGDGVKHGDLDTSLLEPDRKLDIHMAKDGEGYDCVTCHKTEQHQTPGSRYLPITKDVRGRDVVGGSRATCESCHGLSPHPATANEHLNDHVARIACQTCHIPAFARGGKPTKTYWDWSTAGRLDGQGKAIVEKDEKGRVTYSSQRGSSRWAENVVPDYIWFNGEIEYITLEDEIDPDGLVRLNVLNGSPDDPDSRIWPVKTLRGKQPVDTGNKTLLAARFYGKKKDAYWKAYDWQKSIAKGMETAGLSFSGQMAFAETEMRIPINHMVAPAEDSLKCDSCHARNGRLAGLPGIYMPGGGNGYTPLIDLLGILLVSGAFIGVLMHGVLRAFMGTRKNRKA